MTLYELIQSLEYKEKLNADTPLTICGDNNDRLFEGNFGEKHHYMYGSRNVVSCDELDGGFCIRIEGGRFRDDQKFYFDVECGSYDGEILGRIKLTFDQALVVDHAVNRDNWEDLEDDGCAAVYFSFNIRTAEPAEA